MSHLEFVDKVVKELENKKLAVYCGAGISFNSGLPIVSQLLDYLYNTLQLDRQEKEKLFESDIPFERVMETVLVESTIDDIKQIFTTGLPNYNHLFLAKLAKDNWIETIYTTNFDILIEQALKAEDLLEGVHFKVYRTENELREINWEENIIKIIKIHGCASKVDDMAITLGQLASNRYLDLRENLLSKIFSAEVNTSVLVMGYSCSDFDLVPLIDTLENKSSKIYFIDHSSTDSRLEDITLKQEKNPFKKYKGWRYIGDTNGIVKSICEQIDLNIPPRNDISYAQRKLVWNDNFDNWYNRNVEEHGEAFAQHVAGKIMYSIGAYQDVISHMQKAMEKNYKQRNWIAYASNLDTMGMARNKLGEYEDAVKCFEKAILIQRQLDDELNLASMLQSYANVLHHLRRDNEAIVLFKEALNIAIKYGNNFLESNVLGNMSNSFTATGQFLKAKHSLTKALKISRDLGNKQAESSQLGMMAYVYIVADEPQRAIEPLLEAIEIKKAIADYDNLCGLYLNLATAYHLTDNRILSTEIAKKGLDLAKKIGSPQRINEFQQARIVYALT